MEEEWIAAEKKTIESFNLFLLFKKYKQYIYLLFLNVDYVKNWKKRNKFMFIFIVKRKKKNNQKRQMHTK